MPASVQVGDKSLGHPTPGPTPAVSGSPNHFVNGKPVVRVTDNWTPHSSPLHTNIKSVQGSPNVFSGGLARVRTGDSLSCGDKAGPGSPNVFING